MSRFRLRAGSRAAAARRAARAAAGARSTGAQRHAHAAARRCCGRSRLWTVGDRGAAGSTSRSSQHDELTARAEQQQTRTIDRAGQARRHPRSQRPRARLQRRRRHDRRRSRRGRRTPDEAAAAVCARARRLRRRRPAARWSGKLRGSGQFAYLAAPGLARRGARASAPRAQGVGFSRRAAATTRTASSRRTCSATSASTTSGSAGSSRRYDAQIRGSEGKLLRADRRAAAARLSRESSARPTAGATLELTIDQYLQHIAERELRAGVEENQRRRRHGDRSWIRTPARSSRWPTTRPSTRTPSAQADDEAAAQPRHPGRLRARLDVQDRHRVGGARGEACSARPIDRLQPRLHHVRRPQADPRRPSHYGTLSFDDVIVKSSNVGAIKVGLQLGPERLGRYVNRFGFGQTLAPDFRGESAGIVWNPAELDASALASVSMGYQVGVTPLQMAAAVSSVANGGTLYRAARRARVHPATAAASRSRTKALRRTISPETAAHADRDHGSGRRARHRRRRRRSTASPSPARPAPPHEARRTAATRRPTTTRRSSASCRRASRRSRSSSSSTRRTARAPPTAAPSRRRSSSASPRRSLRHLGVGADDQRRRRPCWWRAPTAADDSRPQPAGVASVARPLRRAGAAPA